METLKNLNPVTLTENKQNQFREILETQFPDRVGQTFEHNGETYNLFGKYNHGQTKYAFEKDGQFYTALIVTPKVPGMGATGSNVDMSDLLGPLSYDIVKMGEIEYDPNIFVPMVSNTPLDYVFSKKGGLMPATNFIVIGDPGIGKTTISVEYAAQMQAANPDLKVLFVSGEMTRVDMYEYIERFVEWKNLSTVFLSEFTEGRYKETIEDIFSKGWDLIVLDSFAEINEAVKEDYNMNAGGKMTTSGAEKWLIDQFIKHNLGENELKKYSSFVSIQQVTKGGGFVGSNKLKHNTTGMIELRYTRSGESIIVVSKNRRGYKYTDLFFKFQEEGEPIHFDVARIERELEIQKKIDAEKDTILTADKLATLLNGSEETDTVPEEDESLLGTEA